MHLPTQKFSNEISIDKGLFLDIANFIRQNQLVSGAIPSNEDLSHDPCCLLYTSPSPRDLVISRMPSSA